MFHRYLPVATAALLATAPIAQATTVDLELLLLTDNSGSVTSADFGLQLDGYAAAFRNSTIIDKVENGAIGSIAVSVAFFADTMVQATSWFVINDVISAEAFATAVDAIVRPDLGIYDQLSNAMEQSLGLFNNGITGTRQVLDIVTEGADTSCGYANPVCLEAQAARDLLLAGGVDQINALLLDDRTYFGDDDSDLIDAVLYGETNMIGGPGSFAAFAEDFTAFPTAIADKILREIKTPESDVPIPGTSWLLLGGLAGLGAARMRKRT